MDYLLKIRTAEGIERDLPISEGEITIGRDPKNSLVLSGRGVSRHHAKVTNRGGRVSVVDLGSTYGTRVNDMPTLRRELQVGDSLKIGMHTLLVEKAQSSGETALPLVLDDTAGYFPDEVTHDPRAERHLSKTPLQSPFSVASNAVQFVNDRATAASREVEILQGDSGEIRAAVERMERRTPDTGDLPLHTTVPPRSADYHALLMMYKVSQLLAEAPTLEDFVSSVAEMVMEEVRANTVVVLLGESEDALKPAVIRHRGLLDPGEVPISTSILDLVRERRTSVLSSDGMADERFKAGQSMALYNIRAAAASPLILRDELRGILYLHRAGAIPFSKAEGDLVSALAALLANGLDRAELKERVTSEQDHRRRLERFHPPEVVQRLAEVEADTERQDGLKEHTATVLVCDMRGFDQLVPKTELTEVASVLAEYYDLLYDKVFANGGSLVKLHDGWALALFGMHSETASDAVWAVEAARQICEEFIALSVLWPDSNALRLRCALDTGSLVAGVVGSGDRLDYVALGEPINNAKLLAREPERSTVLVTEATWSSLPQQRYRSAPMTVGGQRVHKLDC